jgi:hypothetical protein
MAAVVLVIAAAIGGWAALRGGTPAARQPANPIMQALALANGAPDSKGFIPRPDCHPLNSSMVTCTQPRAGVDVVKFQTFPTLAKLYDAYVAAVRTLGNKKGNSIKQNFGNCLAQQDHGELSWNHNYHHPRIYDLAKSRSGTLITNDLAEGRVFCQITGSEDKMVWTEDSGRLLGSVSGFPHTDVWQWWQGVHHNIAFPGGKRMGM